MQRSPFSTLPAAHKLFSPSASPSRTMRSPSHSRTRNSGSAGTTSSDPPTLLFDSDPGPYHRSQSRGRSPAPEDDPDGLMVPMHSFHSSGASSRGASPYPASEVEVETDRLLGRSEGELRIGEGSSGSGVEGWMRDGKLGRWFWGTQRGWVVYVLVLMVAYGLASLGLLVMNRFILWTGVYKFGYPITTTFVELVVTQLMLYISASLTRSFSRSLYALGLDAVIAPRPKPSKGKQRAQRSLREFAYQTFTRSGGDGIFSFKFAEAKVILPLAVIYSVKLILSNLSFAYTQLQIYQVSRTPTLLVTLVFMHFFYRSQTLSVTSLSSCITMVLALVAASLRPGTRFAVEGFLAGIFSTIFVAAYPILLSKTHRTFIETPTSLSGLLNGDAFTTRGAREQGVLLSGDGKDETRAAWKLLHYVNVLSVVLVFFCAVVSGEIRDISRNCYFLDVAFFWLMMLGAGTAAWATFVTGFLLLRATTPLTMNVVGYPRATVQTLLLMGFKLPTWSWVGVLTCWGSAIWYFVGRRRELGVVISGREEEEGLEYRRGRTRSVVEHMMG